MFWRCSIVRTVFKKGAFVFFFEKVKDCKKVYFNGDALPTLRVGRPVTRLTVHWALQYWGGSKRESKGAATFGEKTHFEVNNI